MSFTRKRAIQAGALVCALALPSVSAAATIYGFIQDNNRPAAAREVVLKCGGNEVAKASTDSRGNYRLSLPRTGRCVLTVGTASGNVVLYPEPTQYNFEIRSSQLVRR